MAGVGLTHGGFYSYFNSKSDLYAAVLGCFFTDPEWKSCWEGVKVDLSRFADKDAAAVAREILGMEASPQTIGAIEKGTETKKPTPQLLVSVLLDSPEFQRR